jgi:N-carbamoyl-L-amino-acid hydrolase
MPQSIARRISGGDTHVNVIPERSVRTSGDFTMLPPDSRIDPDRLRQTLEASAAIGTRAPGLSRLALGDDDREMRTRFVQWCQDAGLSIAIDRMGNIFARRDGLENDLPAVVFGSHLDTQEEGGRFDGILGVLGALEVIRTLNDTGHVTRRPLMIVNWTNEEGARFPPPMLGSGCFTGALDTEWAYRIPASDNGIPFGEELERIGYLGQDRVDLTTFDSYLELHIEQGPMLEQWGKQIGIVTGGARVHGFRFEFHGETAHAGTRPMELRRNALVAGARFAAALDDIGHRHAGEQGMSTTTRITASPNKSGIISNYCEHTGDIRHPDLTIAAAMWQEVQQAAADAAARANCNHACVETWTWGGDIFDHGLIDLVRDTTAKFGYSHTDIISRAGHDAYYLAEKVPTAMIFVPCAEGITHNLHESITWEDAAAGTNVLLHAVTARADR